MDALLQHLQNPAIAIPILLFIVCSVYNRLTAVSNIPKGVPWVGKDSSKLFADTRASLASFGSVTKWLEIGYETVHSPILCLEML